MESKKTINGNEVVIELFGRIDTTNSNEVESILSQEFGKDKKVVVDFSNIEYISSAGLRVLLTAHKALVQQGGSFVIRHVNEEVLEVFDITGFSSILNIED